MIKRNSKVRVTMPSGRSYTGIAYAIESDEINGSCMVCIDTEDGVEKVDISFVQEM